ncbi:MAG: tetratricopeptide repeat protein [Bacteroidetes bacterium]|nr:tetratricopeptide repeat protein [Bacteroidota bacterium]
MKRTILILILSATLLSAEAQQTARQTAFSKSYELEKATNYTAAIKELNKVYDTGDYFVNIRLGWLYYLAKNHTESIRFYDKAISLKPYAIEAKFGLIKPLSAIENWEKVKNEYIQILKIDPQNTIANYWLGVIYYNRKDYTTANKLFEKIVNLYPLDYDSAIMLAWTKLRLGKTPEAKVLFTHALTLRPNDSSSLDGLKQIK